MYSGYTWLDEDSSFEPGVSQEPELRTELNAALYLLIRVDKSFYLDKKFYPFLWEWNPQPSRPWQSEKDEFIIYLNTYKI